MLRYLTPPPPPRRLSAPPGRGRVLVLAPHPDDETIGVGATLALHRQLGDPVDVVFLTAGTAGDPTGRAEPAAYARTREREARAAAAVLDLASCEFWGYPDNCQVNENDLALIVPRVREVLERRRPDVVYAPHEGEQHSDHFVAAVALRRALAGLGPGAMPPPAFGYEVWSASLAEAIVDVSAVYDTKLRALACYRSQLDYTDIERFISGLNSYRAVFLEKGARFGEAFVPLSPSATAGAA